MALQFTDSLSENKELIAELVRGMPVGAQNRAKRTALAFEKFWQQMIRDNPKDPAVALGAAFAVYELADRIVKMERGAEGQQKGLIEIVGGTA